MKKFINDNFLLNTQTAVDLYHKYAKDMPIFDYHCHLNPVEIAENRRYENITKIWLDGDHYKWRALRSNGIDEKYITGDASDYEKFEAWCKTVPYLLGNPLYHWSHLELKRFFGIDVLISEETAGEIWEKANRKLESDEFTVLELIKKSNVRALCTTDDPIDSLKYHKIIRENQKYEVKVLPTFRPDKAMNIDHNGFKAWVTSLGQVSNMPIENYDEFIKALKSRVEFFHEQGCRISDHGIEDIFSEVSSEEEVEKIYQKGLKGEKLTQSDVDKFKTMTLLNLSQIFYKLNWTMQLHIGALRNNNSRMFEKIGADTGFDSINDGIIAKKLSKLLDSMDMNKELPRTILYCLNPRDNDVIATMIGNFQGGGIPGKIQFGSGWWFNDQKDGMEKQMKSLANLGLLRRFVGMVTDSRSFLSYTRHEYFRRVLCNLIGSWVENGEVPNDINLLGSMVEEICYKNAVEYFGIEI